MRSAKQSLAVDIEAGFDMIHLDSSEGPDGPATVEDGLQRLFELYSFCHEQASRSGRHLLYEVGTDSQDVDFHDLELLEYQLDRILHFCLREHLPSPCFVVVQTGTKVMETRNVAPSATWRPRGPGGTKSIIERLVVACRKRGIWLKEHNADYLPDDLLACRPAMGIHAVNVAPEFGVLETRALLRLLAHAGLAELSLEFTNMVISSGRWQKWMLSDTAATDLDRVEIAGHYLYAHPGFRKLLALAAEVLAGHGINLQRELKDAARAGVWALPVEFQSGQRC